MLLLGFIVTAGSIQMDPTKVKTVTDRPVPSSHKLQHSLGFVIFYKRFIHNYSSVPAPLGDLTSQNTPFVWSQPAEEAFGESSRLLSSPSLWWRSTPLMQE